MQRRIQKQLLHYAKSPQHLTSDCCLLSCCCYCCCCLVLQVSLLLPRAGHARFNTIRAVVRDGNDDNVPETWLDSDGLTSSSSYGSVSGFYSTSIQPPPSQNPNLVNLWDGEWHHVVVSSLPPVPQQRVASSSSSPSAGSTTRIGLNPSGGSGGSSRQWGSQQPQPYQQQPQQQWRRRHGYRLFVDGLMRAELRSEQEEEEEQEVDQGGQGGGGGGADGATSSLSDPLSSLVTDDGGPDSQVRSSPT